MLAAYGESYDPLLGRRTYDIWSGFWPKAPSSPMADRLNAATQFIATHRPESLEWGPFEGVGPDIVEGGGPADCWSAVCGATYPAGTRVTLTTAAAAGSTFMGWGGECSGTSPTCVVRLDRSRDVMVHFGK